MSAAEPTSIVIPQVSVNEDVVTVSSLAVKAGTQVSVGDIVFSVSTSKADMDVDTQVGGYFWPVVQVGDQVRVGAIAAYLTETPDKPATLAKPEPVGAAPRATHKAVELAKKLGVDLGAIDQRGIIRESDIEAFAARQTAKPAARLKPSAPAPETRAAVAGRIDPEFLASIRRPGSGFAQLASDLKVMLYRKHGAVIDQNVTFEPGAVIYAEAIEIGDGCQFGSNTVIYAETLRMGVGCLIGHDNDIMCRRIQFGDMLFLVNRVLIGQGGAFNDEAELIVGHSCLISSDCLVNTASQVRIGDRSCLSPRVSIFTHSHWQNVLDGYHANFAPVSIGNDVWITGNCIVTPGAIMEDGSQALASSVVSGHVPERTIVSGVPAKPVGKVRGGLPFETKDQLMRGIWHEVERAARQAGLDPADAVYAANRPDAGTKASVQVAFGPRPAGYEGTHFDLDAYQVVGPNTRMADEVRNVLRKHGIRFEPHHWRYRADVGRFNA